MSEPSSGLALIQNLVNAGRWHQAHCADSCDVSLTLLQELARQYVEAFMGGSPDVLNAINLIEGMLE